MRWNQHKVVYTIGVRIRATTAAGAALAQILLLALAPGVRGIESPKDAEAVARQYLEARVNDDRATMRRLRPSEPQNRYGRCPFAAMPVLDRPAVKKHQARVYFTDGYNDPSLAEHGVFLLTRIDEDTRQPWKIGDVLWYNKPPIGVSLPRRSETRADALEEPKVLQAVKAYVAAWKSSNWETMKRLTDDWLQRPGKGKRAVIRSVGFEFSPAPGMELRVDFTARLFILRFFPKTAQGTLFMVKENDEWKVRERGLTF
jgi:hypothetical protein